ncbi:alpha/beta fold hydrolase [Nocardia sp. NPDC004278]
MSAAHSIRDTGRLAPGVHIFDSDGISQRYHVYGSGPVCVAHPGGPGIFWDYLRMPALEEHLTMVYVEALGTGESGRLPTHPHGYTRERYSLALQRLIDHLDVPTDHSERYCAAWELLMARSPLSPVRAAASAVRSH